MPNAPIPAPTAAPPVIGLLASIAPVRTDVRWETPGSVLSYRPEGCNQNGDPFNPCDTRTTSYQAGPSTVEWVPYGLEVTERCSTFGTEIAEGEKARVRRLMLADTERQLGAEFWDGALADIETLPGGAAWPNTWLANVADVDILTESGPVSPSHGLHCLDQYLASNNSGQQGAIHATVQTLGHWTVLNLVTDEGKKFYSPGGNLIITSPGYSGTDPNGNVGDDNIWAYATDMPRIFLGDIQVHPLLSTIERRRNRIDVQATRMGLVEWQRCRHAGVRLSISVCDIGGS